MGAKDTKFKGRTAGSWGSQDLIPAKKETWGGGGVDRSEELAGLGRGTGQSQETGFAHHEMGPEVCLHLGSLTCLALQVPAVPDFRWLDLQFFHFTTAKSDRNTLETTPPISNLVFSWAGAGGATPPCDAGQQAGRSSLSATLSRE